MIAGAMVAGAVAWSFSEYALHRWVGHDPKSESDFADEHRRHHAARFYFAPTLKKVTHVGPVVAAAAALARGLAGRRGVAFVASFALTYVGYELVHRRLHTHGPRGAVGRYLRRHHFAHHFKAPQGNHGVTSPLWDLAFGTLRDPGVIRVPEKLAMSWLVDPATGDARAEYAADYVIHHPKRRAPGAATVT